MTVIKSVSFGGLVYTECSSEYLLSAGVPASVVNGAALAQAVTDAQTARRAAYALESDPLYLEWQYDQTPESEKAWRDKVAEIKGLYPIPGE